MKMSVHVELKEAHGRGTPADVVTGVRRSEMWCLSSPQSNGDATFEGFSKRALELQ
jgi:hypothetical protein